MALSDVEITTSELEELYHIGQERGIAKEEINEIILNPDKVQFYFPETLEEKVEYLYDFVKIIFADGKVDSNEQRLLNAFIIKFGFHEEHSENICAFLISSFKDKIIIKDILNSIKENL